MSFAWEVTAEDLAVVLGRHNIERDAEALLAECFDEQLRASVEKAALAFVDFDEQCHSALDEIETIMIELGVVAGPKLYT